MPPGSNILKLKTSLALKLLRSTLHACTGILAFDIVKLLEPIDLNNLAEVEKNLWRLIVTEIKSTRKQLKPDFFGLSGVEVLVAQSLRDQFRFAFVNPNTGGPCGTHFRSNVCESEAHLLHPEHKLLMAHEAVGNHLM